MANKLNASKMLDELVADSLGYLRYIKKNEDLNISMISKDDIELKRLKVVSSSELELIEKELESKEDELKRLDVTELLDKFERMNGHSNKTYVIEDLSEHEISNELVLKYIGSWMYDNLIDLDSRNGDKIDTGYPLKYLDLIVRYMCNEYDVDELNGVKFDDFCRELMEMRIPFRSDIMNRLYNDSNEYGIGWKNRYIVIKKKEYKMMFDCVKLRLSKTKI